MWELSDAALWRCAFFQAVSLWRQVCFSQFGAVCCGQGACWHVCGSVLGSWQDERLCAVGAGINGSGVVDLCLFWGHIPLAVLVLPGRVFMVWCDYPRARGLLACIGQAVCLYAGMMRVHALSVRDSTDAPLRTCGCFEVIHIPVLVPGRVFHSLV